MAGERLVEFLDSSSGAAVHDILDLWWCVEPLCAAHVAGRSGRPARTLRGGARSRCRHHHAQSTARGEFEHRRWRDTCVGSEHRARSRLIMVDNVVSGERWVASGLTFEYAPVRDEVRQLRATSVNVTRNRRRSGHVFRRRQGIQPGEPAFLPGHEWQRVGLHPAKASCWGRN